MSSDMVSGREERYDIAKTIAICLVVYGHLLSATIGYSSKMIGLWHMPVFFYISGYFFAKSVSKYSPSEIVYRKIKTLFIPYWIWSFISFLANCFLRYLNDTLSVQTMIEESINIFLRARSVWFLAELFVTSIMLLLFKIISDKLSIHLACISAVGWLLLSLVIPSKWISFFKFKWLFPFFVFGYFISCYCTGIEIYSKKARGGYVVKWNNFSYWSVSL